MFQPPDSYYDRMLSLADEAHRQGVSRWTFAPPLYRLMRRLGVNLRPPMYQRTAAVALGTGMPWGVGFGLIMFLSTKAAKYWIARTLESSPLSDVELLIGIGAAALVGGAGFGLAVAKYFRTEASRLRLPALSAEPGAR